MMQRIRGKVKFSFHILTHPFDGFWDMKHEKKGSLFLALFYVLLWVLSNIITHEFTSFLFNEKKLVFIDVGMEFQKVFVIFLLFSIGNWSITTLMEGEGTFRDIMMVFGYSCLPISLINIPLAIISRMFTYQETVYYTVLSAFAFIWFGFLLFTGIMTIHQYTVSKMVGTIVLTAVAMIALVFIYLLFFQLISRFIAFAMGIFQEMSFRI